MLSKINLILVTRWISSISNNKNIKALPNNWKRFYNRKNQLFSLQKYLI